MSEKSYSASYAAAGVDITAGYRAVEITIVASAVQQRPQTA